MLQLDGPSDEIMPLEPFTSKWQSFGWNVFSVDGHCIPEILKAMKKAEKSKGRSSVILAKTVKGKGVSFMGNRCEWHSGSITKEQFKIGLADLHGGENLN